jgi:hypothetical protein
MSGHAHTGLHDPFTGHTVGIDNGLIPIIEALWALDIETASSCEGHPGFGDAVICFADPDSDRFEASPEGWDRPGDPDSPEYDAWMDAALEWEEKTAPNGAKQLWRLLFGDNAEDHAQDGPRFKFRTATRDGWDFQLDGGGNPGSGLLLPPEDLPKLAALLAAKVTAEDRRRTEVRRAMWRLHAQHATS